jgi:hypothetical protein
MRNLIIWLVDLFKIWPMTSAYSAIQGFDWVLVSRAVSIFQIFKIWPLRVCNSYTVYKIHFDDKNFFSYFQGFAPNFFKCSIFISIVIDSEINTYAIRFERVIVFCVLYFFSVESGDGTLDYNGDDSSGAIHRF